MAGRLAAAACVVDRTVYVDPEGTKVIEAERVRRVASALK